jgi:2-hydroxymuconate-semialdehyde hydrolase
VTLPVERKRTRISAGDMAYVDIGDGPPVVLLHGFPTSAHLWRREAWLLAQRFRVIAPDLIGYGESDEPVGADLSEPAQARYVNELLRALGIDSIAVVGHDTGGAISQMLALDGDASVGAMVLLDSACFAAWPARWVQRIQSVPSGQQVAPFVEEVVMRAFADGVAHPDRLDEDTVSAYLRPWLQNPPAFFRAARALTGKGLAGRDAELVELDIPALIIWGESDPFLPASLAEALGELISGSTVALLPGCSHFVTEDAPRTVGPLIYEYLRARYLGERHSHGGNEPVEVFLERPHSHRP